MSWCVFVVAALSAVRRNTMNTNANTTTEGQLRSRRKAAKMLVAVVIMFAVCYFPVHLLCILRYRALANFCGGSVTGNCLGSETGYRRVDGLEISGSCWFSCHSHPGLTSAPPHPFWTTCFNPVWPSSGSNATSKSFQFSKKFLLIKTS